MLRRLIVLLLAIAMLLPALATTPAYASDDWCPGDPPLLVDGKALIHVDVLIPTSQLANVQANGPVQLVVTAPANTKVEVLPGPSPFPINVTVVHTDKKAGATVEIETSLVVPTGSSPNRFAARLQVSGSLNDGFTEGKSGSAIKRTIKAYKH